MCRDKKNVRRGILAVVIVAFILGVLLAYLYLDRKYEYLIPERVPTHQAPFQQA